MVYSDVFSFENWDQYESRTAIVCGDRSCTYGELRNSIEVFGEKLYELGVRKGDHVAIWAFNSINWLVSYYAIIRIGGIATLVNYNLAPSSIVPLLELTHTNFLIYGDTVARRDDSEAAAKLLEDAGIDSQRSFDVSLESIDLVCEFGNAPVTSSHAVSYDGDETAFIVFSSGTTSLPKAVQLSRRSISQNAEAFYERLDHMVGPTALLIPPFFHVFGLSGQMLYLSTGSTIVLSQSGTPEELISLMKRHDFTDMLAVGTTHLMLMGDESFNSDLAPNLRTCVITGGVSTNEQMTYMESHYRCAKFINVYGLTELVCIAIPSPNDSQELRFSSLGQPAPGTDLRIIGLDGKELPPNTPGEVIAKGEGLTNGYMGLGPDEQPYDEQGWLHTGDLGYLSDDGYLYLVGRIKDIIIRGGENIAPSVVKAALQKLENVAQAVVMGIPHPIFGESVEAFVTLEDPTQLFDEETAKVELRKDLARFQVPSHIIVLESFPTLSIGKPDMRVLKEEMIKRLGAKA